MDIGIAFSVKLLEFILLFLAFPERSGIINSSVALIISLIVQFSPWIIDLCIFYKERCIFRTLGDCLLSLFHFVIGIWLIIALEFPDQKINLSDRKGLTGLYVMCSAYSLFRTFRDFVPPTWFEMFGWFEVVFRHIVKLLAVSKQLNSFCFKMMVKI